MLKTVSRHAHSTPSFATTQLGEEEAIKPYWVNGPRAVDQAGWKKIIGDKPTLIMLDELPPYLENASTTVIGGGTLATVSTYTLSCLMSAALELPRCCIVIANYPAAMWLRPRQLPKQSLTSSKKPVAKRAPSPPCSWRVPVHP
ncbi:hypothetical protein [Pseudomonas aeruginosa]|uniref:hypothetical protein n=1 Tax=Pseudomonas aeruginosa TaxID=287 RepID=UPI001C3CB9C5|nr:hypothetical protein [Pseudomonas aeruginosa]